MAVTPSKDKTNCFLPKELSTPVKDNSGISKTVFTNLSNLHNVLDDWTKLQNKGVKVCKSISALKLYECNEDYYPQELRPLTGSLLEALDGLKSLLEDVALINKQMQALSKLQPNSSPVIYTWSAKQIADSVLNIYTSLQKELELKQVITENIAHCRDENLIEVYASAWECNVYLKMETFAYLFVEVGVTGVT